MSSLHQHQHQHQHGEGEDARWHPSIPPWLIEILENPGPNSGSLLSDLPNVHSQPSIYGAYPDLLPNVPKVISEPSIHGAYAHLAPPLSTSPTTFFSGPAPLPLSSFAIPPTSFGVPAAMTRTATLPPNRQIPWYAWEPPTSNWDAESQGPSMGPSMGRTASAPSALGLNWVGAARAPGGDVLTGFNSQLLQGFPSWDQGESTYAGCGEAQGGGGEVVPNGPSRHPSTSSHENALWQRFAGLPGVTLDTYPGRSGSWPNDGEGRQVSPPTSTTLLASVTQTDTPLRRIEALPALPLDPAPSPQADTSRRGVHYPKGKGSLFSTRAGPARPTRGMGRAGNRSAAVEEAAKAARVKGKGKGKRKRQEVEDEEESGEESEDA